MSSEDVLDSPVPNDSSRPGGSRFFTRVRELARPSIDQLKRLWKPFVTIQLLAFAIVLAYFLWPAFAKWCDAIGAMKARWGILFAMIAMPISSAIVPEVFKTITGVETSFPPRRWHTIGFNISIYIVWGIITDCFYQLLEIWPGESRDLSTVAAKVALDQFVFTLVIGIPYLAFWYTLRRNQFSITRTFGQLGRNWYINEVIPLLIPCWAFWIPMCVLMYLLPPSLTFVFAVTANAAAATILIAVAGRKRT